MQLPHLVDVQSLHLKTSDLKPVGIAICQPTPPNQFANAWPPSMREGELAADNRKTNPLAD